VLVVALVLGGGASSYLRNTKFEIEALREDNKNLLERDDDSLSQAKPTPESDQIEQ